MKILLLIYQVWQLLLFSVFFCALLQSHRDVKCFMKSFTRPKTALETKSASKNRAAKDYEVVDLEVTENTETKFPNYCRQLNNG